MTERPILRLPDPRAAPRKTGTPDRSPKPRGPNSGQQGHRLSHKMQRISDALETDDPAIQLRQDPAGIAPERALVFETATDIQDFVKVATAAGIEVLAAVDLDETEDFPEGFSPGGKKTTIMPVLYATIPTLESLRQIMMHWRAHQRNEKAPPGLKPWWNLFDLLIDLRAWGPTDRLPEGARAEIEARLPQDNEEEVMLEIEIWPTKSKVKRIQWRRETEAKVTGDLGGRIIDRGSIGEEGLISISSMTSSSLSCMQPFRHWNLSGRL